MALSIGVCEEINDKFSGVLIRRWKERIGIDEIVARFKKKFDL